MQIGECGQHLFSKGVQPSRLYMGSRFINALVAPVGIPPEQLVDIAVAERHEEFHESEAGPTLVMVDVEDAGLERWSRLAI